MTTLLSKLKCIVNSYWRNKIILSPAKTYMYYIGNTNNVSIATRYYKWSQLNKYYHQSCSLFYISVNEFYSNKCVKQTCNKSETKNVKKPMINISKTMATITGLSVFFLTANIVAFGEPSEWYTGTDNSLPEGEQLQTVIEIDSKFHNEDRIRVTDHGQTVTSASTKWGHVYADYYCYINEQGWRQFRKYKMKKYSLIYTLIINEIYKNNIYIGANNETLFNGNWKQGDEIRIEIDLKDCKLKCIVNDELIGTKLWHWRWITAGLLVKMRQEICSKCRGKGAMPNWNIFKFFKTDCDKCSGSGYWDSSVTLKKFERRMELK